MSLAASLKQWLFRWVPDDRPTIVLKQRRVFIVPARAGVVFAVVLAVMLLGAINYDLALGHALVFLLAGIGLTAMVHTFRNLLGLRLTPGRADPVFAGGVARFAIHVEAPGRLPRRALEFAFSSPGAPRVSIDVEGGGNACVLLPAPAPRRGRLIPGRITLCTRYPLGLYRAWSYLQPSLSCLVYPRPIETPLPAPGRIADARESGARDDAGDDDFNGLRQHQPSDSPRHVAWKALARDLEHAPLLVKQFAGARSDELWLDWSAADPRRAVRPAGHAAQTAVDGARDGETEVRLALLAGWVLAAERERLRYGLRLPGRTLLPGQGRAHRDACLEALALHGLA
jgi:uncharacterized protein (DUF58 family)